MDPVNSHNNFIYFTLSLVVLLLTSALRDMLPSHTTTLFSHAVGVVTFAVAYITLSFGPNWHRFVGTILVLSVLANLYGEFFDRSTGEWARHLLALIFFTGAAYNAARQVLLTREIEANIIVGALAIYLLLGLIWASLYAIVTLYTPLAFNGIDVADEENIFPQLLYFSYVTLTTLGYGDITPAIALTRTLAYLEAIAGTFYLAIVVASLIGARRNPKPQ